MRQFIITLIAAIPALSVGIAMVVFTILYFFESILPHFMWIFIPGGWFAFIFMLINLDDVKKSLVNFFKEEES